MKDDDAAPDFPLPAELRRRRRLLTLLLAPVVLTSAASLTGTALAPSLLIEAPLLLIALNPVTRHLVLVSGLVDATPFFLVAVTRLFLADPFYFLVGRSYGDDAVAWLERRSGYAGRLVRYVERLFQVAGPVVLFVAPLGLVSLLAGASRMRFHTFVVINLCGTITVVTLVRLFGVALERPLEVVRTFVEANVLLLTLISAGLVAVSVVVRHWRSIRRR